MDGRRSGDWSAGGVLWRKWFVGFLTCFCEAMSGLERGLEHVELLIAGMF